MTKDCVGKAVAKGVKREKAKQIRDFVQSKGAAKWEARAEELKAIAKKEAERKEKRAAISLSRRVRAQQHIERAPSPQLGLQSLLIGTNTPFEGSRMSAEAAIEGYTAQLIGTFKRELGDAEGVFRKRVLEREWVRELFELNRKPAADGTQRGNPGVSRSPEALKIAKAVKTMQDLSRNIQNRGGADIGELDGYIARTEHSAELLEAMGRDNWISLVKRTADLERTFGIDRVQEWDSLLSEMYDRLRKGDFSDFDAEEDKFVLASMNIAKAASESRVLQFSTAEGWYDYQLAASTDAVTDKVIQQALRGARNAGLMDVLGPNPKDNFAKIAERVRVSMDTKAERDALEADIGGKYDRWLSIMTGDFADGRNKITNKGLALAVQNWLTLQRTAKLGMLPLSQVVDLSTVMSELHYQGVKPAEAILGPLGGYFRGRGSQQREVAGLLGAAVDGWIAEINAQMELLDANLLNGRSTPTKYLTATLNGLQDFMFRYSGASAMTNRAKEAGLYLMAKHWGAKRGVAFDALNAAERRIMQAFQIGESEWRAYNAAEWTLVQGDVFLTPHIVENIPSEELARWKAAAGKGKADDASARHELATRLWRYYADRERYAILGIGVLERSFMTQGNAPDKALGIALRMMFQFKSFTIAMINRVWGRMAHGGTDASGFLLFAASATVLGFVSETLRKLAKLQDPTHELINQPVTYLRNSFIRGGAAGPLADFLFGEFNRHAQRPTGYITGPTGGFIDDSVVLFNDIKAGKDASGSALNLARNNVPLQNWVYTKGLLDATLWAALMEAVKPGWNARVRRKRQQDGVRMLNEALR